ncbi:MAG TPA: hypothetical protein VJY35_05885 [Candidatus Eisenbacteria bacterium]|nr:hypothetical protein [Candidatus Eisenbacteria bacterium]
MPRSLPLIAVALLIAASGGPVRRPATAEAAAPAPATRVPPLDSTAVRRWGEDLDFLAREMPMRHANLFHVMSRAGFDSALASIRGRLPAMARHQVIVELQRLAAMVGDGHSNVSPWRDTVVAFHTLPVTFHRFADGYYVRAATTEQGSLLGARVIRIGPVPIAAAESLVSPLIGRDNAMAPWMYAPLLLRMPEVLHALGLSPDPGRAELGLEINGKARTVTLAADGLFPNLSGDIDRSWDVRPGWVDLRDRSPAPLWLSRTGETSWFVPVAEGRLLYCQINQIQERGERFEAFLARALAAADSMHAERFVLDLRLNGGGNGYYNRAIVRALVRSRYDDRGRLFVITGRRTFSAAQMLISDLEKWTQPIFVGEPSASRGNAYGDSRRLVLPNARVTLRVSTLWWQYWDPRETRPWIAPEVAAPLTVAAYRAGRDPALEAIVRYTPGPSLADRVEPMLAAGDSTAASRAIEAFRADPVNAWLDPADALEVASAVLRGTARMEGALLADRMRARLAPWTMPR